MIYEVFIPDEVDDRVRRALGRDGVPATKAEVEAELQKSIKQTVADIEVSEASNAAALAKRQELAREDWNKRPVVVTPPVEEGVVRDR